MMSRNSAQLQDGQSTQFQIRGGGNWLIFRYCLPSRKRASGMSYRARERCDFALDAVIESLVFLTLSAQIIPRQALAQSDVLYRQLPSSAQIVGPSISICSEHSYHWRSLALADETPKIATDAIMQDLMAKSCVHLPAGSEMIVVEENRAYRVFDEWQKRLKNKTAWHTPLGICLSLALALTTSSFNDYSWIAKGTLRGFFLFCWLASIAWFVWELIRAVKSPSASIESFIAELKKGTTRTEIQKTTAP